MVQCRPSSARDQDVALESRAARARQLLRERRRGDAQRIVGDAERPRERRAACTRRAALRARAPPGRRARAARGAASPSNAVRMARSARAARCSDRRRVNSTRANAPDSVSAVGERRGRSRAVVARAVPTTNTSSRLERSAKRVDGVELHAVLRGRGQQREQIGFDAQARHDEREDRRATRARGERNQKRGRRA